MLTADTEAVLHPEATPLSLEVLHHVWKYSTEPESTPLSLEVLHHVWKYSDCRSVLHSAACGPDLSWAVLCCVIGQRAACSPGSTGIKPVKTLNYFHTQLDNRTPETLWWTTVWHTMCWSTGLCVVLKYWSLSCVELLVHVLCWNTCPCVEVLVCVLCCVLPADGRCENSSVVWLVWSQWILVTTQPSDQSQSTKQLSWGLDHKELSEALICSQLSHTNRGCSHNSPVDWTSSWSDWT